MKYTKIMLKETEEVEAQKAQTTIKKPLASEVGKDQIFCDMWEDKLKAVPLFDGNHHNVSGLLQQKQFFLQAKELMTEFEKTDFTFRICYSLESIARDLQMRILKFPYNFNKTASLLAQEVTWSIEERIESLNKDRGWIMNPNQKTCNVDKNELNELRQQTDELIQLSPEDPTQIESLLNALNQLEELMANPAMV